MMNWRLSTDLWRPAAESIGWMLLHSLWQITLVACVLGAFLIILRRSSANVRYLACCSALLVSMALPVVTFFRLPATTKVTPASTLSNGNSELVIEDVHQPAATAVFNAVRNEAPLDDWAVQPAAQSPQALAPPTPSTTEGTPLPARPTLRMDLFLRPWLPTIAVCWLLGVLIFSVRLICTWKQVRNLTRNETRPVSDSTIACLDRLIVVLRIRRCVQLFESALVEVPTVIGWIKPVILLPIASITDMSSEQIEAILAHELAHIRRADYLMNLVQNVVETLMFYHPAVWWISSRIRQERENCCDDLAIKVCGNRTGYISALVRMEELRGDSSRLSLAVTGGDLLSRVRRLVRRQPQVRDSAWWVSGLLTLAVSVSLIAVSIHPTSFAQSESVKSDRETSTLRGVVNDSQQKPVAGARIDIAIAAPKLGQGVLCPSCYLDCKKWSRTNDAGEFEITGLDPKLKFRVLATAPGKQTSLSDLLDPSVQTADFTLNDFPKDVPPTRILNGIVKGSDGVPVPGALVDPFGHQTDKGSSWGGTNGESAVTDDEGRFVMLLADDFQGVAVRVTAEGYAGDSIILAPGKNVHNVTIPLGTSVKGTLVKDGRPIPNRRVAMVQADRQAGKHFIKSINATTDPNGRFEFHHLPASQRYVIYTPIRDDDVLPSEPAGRPVLTTKFLQVPADGRERDLGALEMSTGHSISGRISMKNGSPLPQNLKLTISRDPAWDLIEVPVNADGNFRMSGLPTETYEVGVRAKGLHIDPSDFDLPLVERPWAREKPTSFLVRLNSSQVDILVSMAGANESDAKAPPETASKPAKQDSKTPSAQPAAETASKSANATETANHQIIEVEKPIDIPPGTPGPTVIVHNEPTPDDGPKLSVHGTVISDQGKRLKGAIVILRSKMAGGFGIPWPDNRDVLARTTADANGRFSFQQVPIPLRMANQIEELLTGAAGAQVVAYADGFAFGIVNVASLDGQSAVQLVLTPETTVSGIVHDDQSNPIRDANVSLRGISSADSQLDEFLQGPNDIHFGRSQIRIEVRTDAAGRFELNHIPKKSRLSVTFRHSHFESGYLWIETADVSNVPNPPPRTVQTRRDVEQTISVSPIEIALKRTSPIRVRVFTHDGLPVKTGVVSVRRQNRELMEFLNPDSNELSFAKFDTGKMNFSYASPFEEPVLSNVLEKEIVQSADEQTIDIQLPKPRWVSGRVVDSESGQPIPGVIVASGQFNQDESGVVSRVVTISGQQGEFRIPAAVGKNFLMTPGRVHGYMTAVDFQGAGAFRGNRGSFGGMIVNVQEDAPTENIELKLWSGMTIEGTVVSEIGWPMANVPVLLHYPEGRRNDPTTKTDDKGQFRFTCLNPKFEATISVLTADKADRVTIPARPDHVYGEPLKESVELVFKSGIRLTGRVVKDGKPVAGLKLYLSRPITERVTERENQLPRTVRMPGNQTWRTRHDPYGNVTTDEDGRYSFGGLKVGDKFTIDITTADGSRASDWAYQHPQAGTVPESTTGAMELPDAVLIAHTQVLSGKVVDRDGKPVEGARVEAKNKNGEQLSAWRWPPPPWSDTNKSGEFRLEKLPEQPIQLVVRKVSPGHRNDYTVKIRPKINESDIRIVYDQTLTEPLEDLDNPTTGKTKR